METKRLYTAIGIFAGSGILYVMMILLIISGHGHSTIGYALAFIIGIATILASWVLLQRIVKGQGLVYELGYFIISLILNQIPFYPPVAFALFYLKDDFFPKTIGPATAKKTGGKASS
jgi:hypothetical protein